MPQSTISKRAELFLSENISGDTSELYDRA